MDKNMDEIKIVILGCSGIGKSTLIIKILKNKYTEDIGNTIGSSFYVIYENNKKLSFWDTAGQERFSNIIPFYYRNSNIILLAFDVNDMKTFDRVKKYAEIISQQNNPPNAIIFIGTKFDLFLTENINKVFSDIDYFVKDEIFQLNISNKIRQEFIYVSSLSNYNIIKLKNLITEISSQILNTINSDTINSDTINLNEGLSLKDDLTFINDKGDACKC